MHESIMADGEDSVLVYKCRNEIHNIQLEAEVPLMRVNMMWIVILHITTVRSFCGAC